MAEEGHGQPGEKSPPGKKIKNRGEGVFRFAQIAQVDLQNGMADRRGQREGYAQRMHLPPRVDKDQHPKKSNDHGAPAVRPHFFFEDEKGSDWHQKRGRKNKRRRIRHRQDNEGAKREAQAYRADHRAKGNRRYIVWRKGGFLPGKQDIGAHRENA